MTSRPITLVIEQNIAKVGIARSDKKNALSLAMVRRLTDVAIELGHCRDVRAVVLHGAPKMFSAGADLHDPERWDIDAKAPLERREIAQAGQRMCKAWEEIPQPTIAAMEGFSVGGAVALALACDFRIQASDGFLLLPEVKIGMPMGWQAVPRLVRLVGPARAKRMLLWGERIPASLAHDWGLVDAVTEPGNSLGTAMGLGKQLASLPALAVVMVKESVNAVANALNHTASYMDVDQISLVAKSRPA